MTDPWWADIPYHKTAAVEFMAEAVDLINSYLNGPVDYEDFTWLLDSIYTTARQGFRHAIKAQTLEDEGNAYFHALDEEEWQAKHNPDYWA